MQQQPTIIRRKQAVFNISATPAASGLRVMQVGCGPKSDSTSTLRGGGFRAGRPGTTRTLVYFFTL
jgi:hypothetical protein